MKRQFVLFSVALVCSCSQMAQEQQIPDKQISVNIVESNTKTDIAGMSILFQSDDRIKLVCEDYNVFNLSNSKMTDVNHFEGTYKATGRVGTACDWYAVYPASLNVDERGVVSGTLPENQRVPFDPSANFMYTGIETGDYCEDEQPPLAMSMNQMMGLIRISFVNNDYSYEHDLLKTVQLSSKGTPLSGSFEFDIHDPESHVTFNGNTSDIVLASYSIKTPLGGVKEEHVLYLFVNPVTIKNATLTIKTDRHLFTYTSPYSFTPEAGRLTIFPEMDLNDFEVENLPYKKTVACWGNSYTSRNSTAQHDAPNQANYPDYLQTLLGEDWVVYNGGYNGWTLPAIIEKLEEWEETNDADLSILYMERNGGFSSWQDCFDRYKSAISHLSNPDDYIVLGAHIVEFWPERGLYPYSKTDLSVRGGSRYEETFLSPFIESGRYKDLYHPVIQDWKNWLVRVGRYESVDEISDEVEYPGGVDETGEKILGAVMIDSDNDGIKDMPLDWPQSFRWAINDVHPSKWGAKAIALLVYDRMVELGYVD